MKYSETEIKMLDVGEALLISEPKMKFTVPVKVLHYPDYLRTRDQNDCNLTSPALDKMDDRLRNLRDQTSLSLS